MMKTRETIIILIESDWQFLSQPAMNSFKAKIDKQKNNNEV